MPTKEYFYNDLQPTGYMPKKIDSDRTRRFGERVLVPQIRKVVDSLHDKGWRFYVCDQTASWSFGRHKVICIATGHWNSNSDSYYQYIVAHECAHAICTEKGFLSESHGDRFMAELIAICPNEWLHYEIGYKPRNAARNGITINGYSKPLPKKLSLDDL